jgi:circadian clock protein KaiC
MVEKQYIPTGVTDFDHLFSNGGYPRGNQILVLGGPGSGKSIFGLQYLHYGVVEFNEPGVYVTFEETPDKVRKNALNFGWNFKSLEDQNKFVIVDAISSRAGIKAKDTHILESGFDINTLLSKLEKVLWEMDAKRLVIDSISAIGLYSQNENVARMNILRLSNALSSHVTSLILSEAKTADIGIREFPPETFLFDGVITLTLDPETQERKIAIRKMRGTKHVLGSFKFSITDHGISLVP